LESYISADYDNDIFTIDKRIFGEAFNTDENNGDDWEIIDIMFRGALVDGSQNIWTTEYNGWVIKELE